MPHVLPGERTGTASSAIRTRRLRVEGIQTGGFSAPWMYQRAWHRWHEWQAPGRGGVRAPTGAQPPAPGPPEVVTFRARPARNGCGWRAAHRIQAAPPRRELEAAVPVRPGRAAMPRWRANAPVRLALFHARGGRLGRSVTPRLRARDSRSEPAEAAVVATRGRGQPLVGQEGVQGLPIRPRATPVAPGPSRPPPPAPVGSAVSGALAELNPRLSLLRPSLQAAGPAVPPGQLDRLPGVLGYARKQPSGLGRPRKRPRGFGPRPAPPGR